MFCLFAQPAVGAIVHSTPIQRRKREAGLLSSSQDGDSHAKVNHFLSLRVCCSHRGRGSSQCLKPPLLVILGHVMSDHVARVKPKGMAETAAKPKRDARHHPENHQGFCR